MSFDKFFKMTSYAVVFCGFLALYVSGGVGTPFSLAFIALLAIAWCCEDTRWQVSERVGTALVIVALPVFYLSWKFRVFGFGGESALAALLSRFILGLSLIKLFQKKRERDWLFLYLMAFFEVLLSAALSISPLYLGVLILYLFITAVAVIAFEITRSAASVTDSRPGEQNALGFTTYRRLPSTAVILIAAVIAFATPVFFLLPRVGGAGFGANQNGLTGMTGFSDSVRLGEIGRIQQSDETVMRVKVESPEKFGGSFRWRGIALDQFDNRKWQQLPARKQVFGRSDREAFFVGGRYNRPKIVSQTYYVEPMDTSVIFALPRAIVVQGGFPEIRKDESDGLTAIRMGMERQTYSVQSDVSQPVPEVLRNDRNAYDPADVVRFLQLPADLDPRIADLASEIASNHENRYDKSRAIESFLQTQFGYTLEQKASGEQPVADFLFNVREGHCEYFASAMVLMLRTQGIAARVVNGFQQGEYNETADVFVVRQRDAHSWVEVLFPGERNWVAFDPTPFAGRDGDYGAAGIFDSLSDYVEALETFWIQYFVAYDNKEQRSLFRSVRDGFSEVQHTVSDNAEDLQTRLQRWWAAVRGDQGYDASVLAIGKGAGIAGAAGLALFGGIFVYRAIRKRKIFERIIGWLFRRRRPGAVEFYERLVRALERRGFNRVQSQTPLEFAVETGVAEALPITEAYNRVRFGGAELDRSESESIERLLKDLENGSTGRQRL